MALARRSSRTRCRDGDTAPVVETPAEHKVFPPFDSTTFASQLLWLAITFVAALLPDGEGRDPAHRRHPRRAPRPHRRRSRRGRAAEGRVGGGARRLREGARRGPRQRLRHRRGARASDAKAAADAERAGIEADLAAKLAAAEARIAEIKTQALAEVGAIAGEATEAIVKALIDADVAGSEVDAAGRRGAWPEEARDAR